MTGSGLGVITCYSPGQKDRLGDVQYFPLSVENKKLSFWVGWDMNDRPGTAVAILLMYRRSA